MLPLRLLLGALFLIAASPKILDSAAFTLAIDNYHFLPSPLVNLWGIVLPWVEIVVGCLLVLGPGGVKPFDKLTEAAAALSALMYLSFFIALAFALARNFDINCGCFDPSGTDTINWLYLLRDGSMFIASLLVFWYHPKFVEG